MGLGLSGWKNRTGSRAQTVRPSFSAVKRTRSTPSNAYCLREASRYSPPNPERRTSSSRLMLTCSTHSPSLGNAVTLRRKTPTFSPSRKMPPQYRCTAGAPGSSSGRVCHVDCSPSVHVNSNALHINFGSGSAGIRSAMPLSMSIPPRRRGDAAPRRATDRRGPDLPLCAHKRVRRHASGISS